MNSPQLAAPNARPHAPTTPQPGPKESNRREQQRAAPKPKTSPEPRARNERPSFASILAQSAPKSLASDAKAAASQTGPLKPTLGTLTDRNDLCDDALFGNTLTEPSLAWAHLQQAQVEFGITASTSGNSSSGATNVAEANFGAMFEQFVSAVRIGKQGEHACVALTLDLGGSAPVQVTIEETSMGAMIDVQSDNPTEALALERALARD